MRTAVDTNIISAVWSEEANIAEILRQLRASRHNGSIVICPVVYVELCAHPRATVEDVQRFLGETKTAVDWEMPRKIWEFAADAYLRYADRRRKSRDGSPRRMPADFIIGAHATWMADRLLTLDMRRYKTDFPDLRIHQC